MSTSNPDLLTLQAQLTTYSHDILENNINSWANVESDARSIANTLAKRLDDGALCFVDVMILSRCTSFS